MLLKDLLFPKLCLGCGYLGSYICLGCQEKLSYIKKDRCFYCQRRSLYGLTHPSCQKKNQFDGFISTFYYSDVLKKIIKNIKYRLVTEALDELLRIICPEALNKLNFYKKLYPGSVHLQSIPLYPQRLKERGFNQADVIVKFLSLKLSMPITNTLERKKNTLSQAQLKEGRARYFNMRGAFSIKEPLRDKKNFLVVDDVVTTGATIKEAAAVLKRNGANRVFAFSLAKG